MARYTGFSTNGYEMNGTSFKLHDVPLIAHDLTNEISRSIIIWKRVFCQNVKLNSLSMYEIVYKFFTNIEKFIFSKANDNIAFL